MTRQAMARHVIRAESQDSKRYKALIAVMMHRTGLNQNQVATKIQLIADGKML